MYDKVNSGIRILWILLLLAGGVPLAAGSVGEMSVDLAKQAPVKYEARGRRDPFVQPQAGRLRSVLENVDIESLRLTGVIRNPKQTIALFVSQSGPKFGYLLKLDCLYRENFQPVPGITGKVLDPKKVMLKQGEKEIVYKLRSN